MPIYEYECRRCGHRFELIQSFSDKPRQRCPECSGKVDRLISPPAIRFKGSGWYVTDYAGKGKEGKGDKEDKGDKGDKAEDGDSGSAAKTDGKDAEKNKAKKKDKKAS